MSEQMSLLLDDVRNELKNIIKYNETVEKSQPNHSKEKIGNADVFKLRNNKIMPEAFEAATNSQTAKNARFLNITANQNIDEEIQRVRLDLKKSYDLLMGASEALESVDFSCISNRIKDLHIVPDESDLDEIIKGRERLPKLTESMSEKFKKHVGEYGDIPELNVFFAACNKLQHGLQDISTNRKSMDNLKKRIDWATDISIKRTDEIKTAMEASENSEKN